MKFRTERVIASPRDEVFRVFTDLEGAPERIRGIDRMELLTEGPMEEGTRFRETRTMFGKEATEEMTVSEFEAGRGYVTLAESCGARYRAGWTFEDCEGGTKVIFDFESTPVTLMAKLTSPILGLFFGRMMKRCLTDDFDDLQKSLESPQIG
ncbi:MAG: SRPBCC family protein [Planctomycetota bacterium]